MIRANNNYIVISLLSSMLILAGCSKKSDEGSTANAEDSTTADLLQASSNVVSDGLSSINTTQTLMSIETNAQEVSILVACNTLQPSACTSGQETVTFNDCTRADRTGATTVTVSGSAILTFSDTSCDMTTNGNMVTRYLSNHYVSHSDGSKVLVYTSAGLVADKTISEQDLNDYTGTARQGGHTLTVTGANSYSLDILGVHRRKVRAGGLYGFWHTVYTTTPLQITRSGDVKTLSGAVKVAHNRLGSLVTTTFTNTTFDSTCCYPTGGSISFSSGGTDTETSFSATCGLATIGGVETSLPACGASAQ